jgi:uncharacterized damage-inducible protein DinB
MLRAATVRTPNNTSRGMMSIAQTLLPEFDNEMRNTRRALERVRPEALGIRPHEKSWTLGELATHIARLPSWVVSTLTSDEFDMTGVERGKAIDSVDEILAEFDRNVAEAKAALAETSDERFMSPWTLKQGERVVFSMPKAAVVRSFSFNHIIHHRGQLTVYLRLAGLKVPGMYGPSADEAM